MTATSKDMTNPIFGFANSKFQFKCQKILIPGHGSLVHKHTRQCILLSRLLQKEHKAKLGLVNARALSIGVTCHVFNLLPKGSVSPLSLIFVHKQLHNICIQQHISSYINNVSDKSLQFLVGHGDYAYQQSSYTEQSYDRSFDDSTQHYYEGGRKIYWQSL